MFSQNGIVIGQLDFSGACPSHPVRLPLLNIPQDPIPAPKTAHSPLQLPSLSLSLASHTNVIHTYDKHPHNIQLEVHFDYQLAPKISFIFYEEERNIWKGVRMDKIESSKKCESDEILVKMRTVRGGNKFWAEISIMASSFISTTIAHVIGTNI